MGTLGAHPPAPGSGDKYSRRKAVTLLNRRPGPSGVWC